MRTYPSEVNKCSHLLVFFLGFVYSNRKMKNCNRKVSALFFLFCVKEQICGSFKSKAKPNDWIFFAEKRITEAFIF